MISQFLTVLVILLKYFVKFCDLQSLVMSGDYKTSLGSNWDLAP